VTAFGDQTGALARFGVEIAPGGAYTGSLSGGGGGAKSDAVLNVVAGVLDVGGDEAILWVGFVAAEIALVARAEIDVGCARAVVGDTDCGRRYGYLANNHCHVWLPR
jgi:hypothetical protein